MVIKWLPEAVRAVSILLHAPTEELLRLFYAKKTPVSMSMAQAGTGLSIPGP